MMTNTTQTENGLFGGGNSGGPSAAQVFTGSFPKMPALMFHPVRCGKANCRCNRGELHDSWRLVWWDGERQRHRYVRKAELDSVRETIAHHHRERKIERRAALFAQMEIRRIRAFLRGFA